jgi:hypothetical protein
MANDLETMRQLLRDVLYDVDDVTWNAGEKDDILQMSVRRLSQRLPRPLDPTAAAQTITLVSETYFYAIDSGIISVEKVFYINSDSDRIGYMESGWEVVGDLTTGSAQLHVSPITVEQGGTLQITGAGRYTLVTQSAAQTAAIPDDYRPYVLAISKAEAYRRLLSDRARFYQWQNANQVQNISMNELIQMVNEADRQALDEWLAIKRWQKPVIGRI